MQSQSRRGTRFSARWVWLVLNLAVIVVLAAAGVMKKHSVPAGEMTNAAGFGRIPDFVLTNQRGKSFGSADLLGRVWIADFIFTRCAGPCPLMSSGIKRLQEKLKAETNVRFVSFSVDPERDTPEVLAKYAGQFGADEEKWIFLTGDKSKIYELSTRGFFLGVSEIAPAQRESPDQSVLHSTKTVLVDKRGTIRGFYDLLAPQDFERLAADAKKFAK